AERLHQDVVPLLQAIERALVPPQPFVPARSDRVFRVALPDLTPSLFAQFASAVRMEAPNATLEYVVWDERAALSVVDGQIDAALVPSAVSLPEGARADDVDAFKWATFARRGHPALGRWGRAAWSRWPHAAVRVGAAPSPVSTAAGRLPRRIAAVVSHFSA